MTHKRLRSILMRVRLDLLAEMRKCGFFYRRVKRFDPTPWDINNGECDNFADKVVEIAKDSEVSAFDMGELDEELAHTVVTWRGRFYDAECVDGVTDWRLLPIVKNCGRTREEVLSESHTM